MDAKMAVEYWIDKGFWESGRFIEIHDKKAKQIADFITEQEKYAEIGRLALEAIKKDKEGFGCELKEMFGDCIYGLKCKWLKFCQKRAELLMEGK